MSGKSLNTLVEDLKDAAETKDDEEFLACVGHLAIHKDATVSASAKTEPAFDAAVTAIEEFKAGRKGTAKATAARVPPEIIDAAFQFALTLINWLRNR